MDLNIFQVLKLTPGAISQTIDVLVKDGMVERCTANHDRRALAIRPTEKAESFRRYHEKLLSRLMEGFLSDVSVEDQATFIRILKIVREKVKAAHSASPVLRK